MKQPVPQSRQAPESEEQAGNQFHALPLERVIDLLNSTPNGLSNEEATKRLSIHGPNSVAEEHEESLWEELLESLREPMVLLLLAATAMYFLIGERRDALAMLLAVVPIISIEVLQAHRTGRALRALRDLVEPTAVVLRGGEDLTISSREVVAGDVLLLRTGDRLPADARLLESNSLTVDESALTGESLPVQKDSARLVPVEALPSDQINMVFAGTMVVEGNAKALVTATGHSTELGRIGRLTATVKEEKTPLERKARQLTKWFALVGGVITTLVVIIGLIRGLGVLPSLLRGLAVAMAAIPEELPVIFTVFLALGVWQMARQRALIRKMTAVETLGAVTTICVDKTGTLTRGQMSVETLYCDGTFVSKTDPHGSAVCHEFTSLPWSLLERKPMNPMDKAVHDFLSTQTEFRSSSISWKVVQEYPFRAELKRRTDVFEDEHGRLLALTRGAPEFVLPLCENTTEKRSEFLAANSHLAERGLRVLAFAYRRVEDMPQSREAAETRMLCAALVGFGDPLREEAFGAVKEARNAGVRVIMITGDQTATALAIAKQLEIDPNGTAVTGSQLAAASEQDVRAWFSGANVFARVMPEHKLRIVRGLQAQGHIVAMTGDGINDAPALRAADIGIAMGQRGTEVARQAARMVLLDDSFATIITAIREGRRIYDNIQKAINYFAATKVALLGFVVLNGILRLPLAFLPIHIVWMELIIDPMTSIVYQAEPAAPDILRRGPRPQNEPLLSRSLLRKLVVQGLTLLFGVLSVYTISLYTGQPEAVARTLAFSVLVLGQILLVLINRSEFEPFWRFPLQSNRPLLIAVSVVPLLQLMIIYVPALQNLFKTASLGIEHWLVVVGVSFASTVWYEFVKAKARMSVPAISGVVS